MIVIMRRETNQAVAVLWMALAVLEGLRIVTSFTATAPFKTMLDASSIITVSPNNHQEQQQQERRHVCCGRGQPLFSNNNNNNNNWKGPNVDSNQWWSSDEEEQQKQQQQQRPTEDDDDDGDNDWQQMLSRQQDGSFWSSFEESSPTNHSVMITDASTPTLASSQSKNPLHSEQEDTEAWLDTLASLTAEEIQFNIKEADRADKVRQMEEWGFDPAIIASTLGVATDTTLEDVDDVDVNMKLYRQLAYRRYGIDDDDIDLTTVESHVMVERDPDSNEPIRSQMVYVDEHTCIGCTHCAMTAQSTFFLEPEHGRARVFQQWGDDDETIQIAIETCPVDCIHYVPYDELVQLEQFRRHQNINFKARLVSQAESGGMTALSHRVGGPNAFTPPPLISGNMKARCPNCPTRGCSNCPMYGVGQNPTFQKLERERQEKMTRRMYQEQRERESKRVDL